MTQDTGMYRIILSKEHKIIIREYIELLKSSSNTKSRKDLFKFASRKLTQGWYIEDEREILNSMRFDVIRTRKRTREMDR